MNVAAFAFTSGLGQKTLGSITLSLTVSLTASVTASLLIVVSDALIMSSRSGELHRELWLLRIFTKSPRTTNFIAFILNGGGGGGIGINGDWLPAFRVSSLKVTVLLGRGGRPEFLR